MSIRTAGWAATAVVVLALAGCGSGGGGDSSPKAGGASHSTQSAGSQPSGDAGGNAKPATTDPCSLLTAAEVTTAVGAKSDEGKVTDQTTYPECEWLLGVHSTVGYLCAVLLDLNPHPDEFDLFRSGAEGAEDVSGVGDKAYRDPHRDFRNNVIFIKGSTSVDLMMRCSDKEGEFVQARQDVVVALGKVVAAKL